VREDSGTRPATSDDAALGQPGEAGSGQPSDPAHGHEAKWEIVSKFLSVSFVLMFSAGHQALSKREIGSTSLTGRKLPISIPSMLFFL
jgi:hypothetical protein